MSIIDNSFKRATPTRIMKMSIHVTMTYKYIHFYEMKILKSNINVSQEHMLNKFNKNIFISKLAHLIFKSQNIILIKAKLDHKLARSINKNTTGSSKTLLSLL